MLLDLRAMDDIVELSSEVCIVGAGAAGISLARRLAMQGVDVLLLESGGPDHEDDVQDLAAGETVGHDYWELREARLRFFGGTTAIWGGLSVKDLVNIDLAYAPPFSPTLSPVIQAATVLSGKLSG